MANESTPLWQLSNGLADAVERAAPSLVGVSARRRFPATGVVWSADGVIVTSDHVIEREENIVVILPGGEEVAATIAGRDSGSDIAVLKVEKGGLSPVTSAPDGSGRVGNIVLALGRPGTESAMASFGVIGTIGGPWRTSRRTEVEGYLRSDTTFFPGFSGGPLIDTEGRMLGLNSSRLGRGAGLTIPTAAVARIAGDLLKGGKVRRAYLGISSQTVALPRSIAETLTDQESGLLVVSVEPGAPAEVGGLMVGDILIALSGEALTETEDLQRVLTASLIGKEAVVSIVRGGEQRQLTLTVGER